MGVGVSGCGCVGVSGCVGVCGCGCECHTCMRVCVHTLYAANILCVCARVCVPVHKAITTCP